MTYQNIIWWYLNSRWWEWSWSSTQWSFVFQWNNYRNRKIEGGAKICCCCHVHSEFTRGTGSDRMSMNELYFTWFVCSNSWVKRRTECLFTSFTIHTQFWYFFLRICSYKIIHKNKLIQIEIMTEEKALKRSFTLNYCSCRIVI